MMKFDILLAKSCDELLTGERVPTHARLVPHLRAVEKAGAEIVETVGELILRQLDLSNDVWLSRLRRALPVACLSHDIGKANAGFQQMVRGDLSPKRQPARHELLSALLLMSKGSFVRGWAFDLLSENGKFDDAEMLLSCVVGAVGGHHVKMDEEWTKASIALRDGGCGTDLQMLLTHSDLRILFGERKAGEVRFALVEGSPNFLGDTRLPFKVGSNRWREQLKHEAEWWRFAAALKALMMAADVAGSALLPEGINPAQWVRQALAKEQFVTSDKMREVVKARLKGQTPREFQNAIGRSKSRVTLVEAGCGSGKTAAAYLWAVEHAPGRKLFFCYPTTGTATEGFLGYVSETDVEAELMHSRAAVDLDGVATVKHDEEAGEQFLRVESLRGWRPQVVVCTADTVLALVRNNRRGLYNSPAILSASIVFDELHAYSDRMFAAVIALIKAMPGAHFLLMTASLPQTRKDFLRAQIADVEQVPTPKDLEELPRYQFQILTTQEEAFQRAKQAAHDGLKVLWICNTVGRAQTAFRRLRDEKLPAITYHSRFKYEDRKQRHRDVIDGFDRKESKGCVIAVTTQVAEMSLDLDADILISEIAPIPSLIQRLGRLNRRITPDDPGEPRTAYFLMPDNALPYGAEELDAAQSWLDGLMKLNRPLCQSDLAAHFNALASAPEADWDTRTEWLDSGWFASPGSVREPGFSVSVILAEDEAACRMDAKERVNKAIPMNFDDRRGMGNWPELKGNLIAPPGTIIYDEEVGATWL